VKRRPFWLFFPYWLKIPAQFEGGIPSGKSVDPLTVFWYMTSKLLPTFT
jgi:hypothetical protein